MSSLNLPGPIQKVPAAPDARQTARLPSCLCLLQRRRSAHSLLLPHKILSGDPGRFLSGCDNSPGHSRALAVIPAKRTCNRFAPASRLPAGLRGRTATVPETVLPAPALRPNKGRLPRLPQHRRVAQASRALRSSLLRGPAEGNPPVKAAAPLPAVIPRSQDAIGSSKACPHSNPENGG